MWQTESVLYDYISKNTQLPSEGLKSRILTDAAENGDIRKSVRTFSGKRAVRAIAIAAISLCLTITTFAYGEEIYNFIVFSIMGTSVQSEEYPATEINHYGEFGVFLDEEIRPGELRRVTHSGGVGTSIKDVYVYDYIELLKYTEIAGILMPAFIPDGYTFDYAAIGAYIAEGSALPLISSETENDVLFEVFSLPEDYESDVQYLEVFFKNSDEEYLRISVTRVAGLEDIALIYETDKQATARVFSIGSFENGIIVESERDGMDRVHAVLARSIPKIKAISAIDHNETISFNAESYTVLTECLSIKTVNQILNSFAQ